MKPMSSLPSVREVVSDVFKNLKLILLALVVPPILAIATAYLVAPVYQADAKVLVKPGREFVPFAAAGQSELGMPQSSMAEVVKSETEILNSDDTLHNIHSLPEKNEAFNLGMPVKGMKYTKKFDKPEVMIRIKCDVHGWMSAYCGVLSHPFFAVTAEDGTYTIKDLPAGTYTIEAWHEKLGTLTQQVTVGATESKPAAFTFKAGA